MGRSLQTFEMSAPPFTCLNRMPVVAMLACSLMLVNSLSALAAPKTANKPKSPALTSGVKTIATPSSLTGSSALAGPVHVTLLQLNDVYSLSPVDKGQRGGLARVATLVKQVEKENPNTFFVLAGDTLSPSIMSKMFQGKEMVDIWNQMGLDIATLGNHEFDFGDAVLAERIKESKFPWVIANVVDRTTRQPIDNLPASIIKTVDGVKIGFFGVLTPDTEKASSPGPSVVFEDPVTTACATVSKLRQQGADIIVGVTHLPMTEDKRLVSSMPMRIAVVLGGHEHTLLASEAGGTPILKMGSDARNLGRIDLFIDPQTHTLQSVDWQVIPVTADVPEDPAIAASVAGYEEKVNGALGEAVGSTTVELDARQATSRKMETNLGDFVADAYREGLKADIALINGGGIRTNTTYAAGTLTHRDILSILPFQNPSVKISLKGSVLKQALENGFSHLGQEEAGRFPQISGMRVVYDGRKPVGSRVVSIQIAGKPYSPSATYTMATSSYLLGGGDDYLMLKNSTVVLKPTETPLDADLVIDAITKAKTIAPKIDGRIQRLDPQG